MIELARLAGRPIRREKFERNVAIEPGVAGAIDLSESAAANRLDQRQVAPSARSWGALDIIRWQVAVNIGQRGQESEPVD